MKAKSIKSRAYSYALGKTRESSYTGFEGLNNGWEAGYRAALRDVLQTAEELQDLIGDGLTTALVQVVKDAGKEFKERMEKLR